MDQAWPGNGVIYLARLSARRVQSRMSLWERLISRSVSSELAEDAPRPVLDVH